MRRGIGIAGLQQQQLLKQKQKELGEEIERAQLQEMNKQLGEFKTHLETFAVKYKKEISMNPVFRNQFLKMCKEIGVDPLSSNKGFWVDVLGVGDFYYELAVSVGTYDEFFRSKSLIYVSHSGRRTVDSLKRMSA